MIVLHAVTISLIVIFRWRRAISTYYAHFLTRLLTCYRSCAAIVIIIIVGLRFVARDLAGDGGEWDELRERSVLASFVNRLGVELVVCGLCCIEAVLTLHLLGYSGKTYWDIPHLLLYLELVRGSY